MYRGRTRPEAPECLKCVLHVRSKAKLKIKQRAGVYPRRTESSLAPAGPDKRRKGWGRGSGLMSPVAPRRGGQRPEPRVQSLCVAREDPSRRGERLRLREVPRMESSRQWEGGGAKTVQTKSRGYASHRLLKKLQAGLKSLRIAGWVSLSQTKCRGLRRPFHGPHRPQRSAAPAPAPGGPTWRRSRTSPGRSGRRLADRDLQP